jgi:hypothetical protein
MKDPKAKKEYKSKAERYKARNALVDEAKRLLRGVPPELMDRAFDAIAKGRTVRQSATHRAIKVWSL